MSKTEGLRFSVVIPCFNEANFISKTLESLRNQDTKSEFEIIVVDNNCSDETVSIAHKYGARVVCEPNSGVCWARQAGTQAAKGEIVVSTDADTLFPSNWLSKIDGYFKSDEKVIAVGGPCRYYDGPWWGKVYTYFLFIPDFIYYRLTGHPFYLTATNIAFKKSAWDGYNLTCMQGGDEIDLLHRLRKKGQVMFVNSNSTLTSARRLTRGLIYNLFVTFLFYYVGAFYINNLFKRQIIGSAPAFRNSQTVKTISKLNIGFGYLSVILLFTFVSYSYFRGFVSDNIRDTGNTVRHIWRDLK